MSQNETKNPHNGAKTQANSTHADSKTGKAEKASHFSAQSDKQRRELWMYLAVSIIAMELFIFVAALFFSFISSGNDPLRFPWLSWAAFAVGVPCVLLVSVHLSVGLFTDSSRQDEEWQRHLPERLQKAYAIIKRAPAMVLLLGLIVIGVALFTIDGAFQLLENFLVLFKPYILHILIGLGIVIILLGLGAFWFNYRTRKLYADYEYRRAVFEKTGLIIVEKNTFILSSDHPALTAIPAESAKALPQGETAQNPADTPAGTAPADAKASPKNAGNMPPSTGDLVGNSADDLADNLANDSAHLSAKGFDANSVGSSAGNVNGGLSGNSDSDLAGNPASGPTGDLAGDSADTPTGGSANTLVGNSDSDPANTTADNSIDTSRYSATNTGPHLPPDSGTGLSPGSSPNSDPHATRSTNNDDITDAIYTEVTPNTK